MVICEECGREVKVRRYESVPDAEHWAPTPYWRGHHATCRSYYCQRGHPTGMVYGSQWVGGGFACQTGECAEFYETWWKLFRKFRPLARGRHLPVVPSEKRADLKKWASGRGGPRAEAVREFLKRY